MCRLFGFRSVIQSQVHRSLLNAENALAVQSLKHPDGWGVAYYVADSPHLIKGVSAAIEDQIFERISGVVTSQTVLAHIRKATVGEVSILNSHPFQFGTWVFAHNGNVTRFGEVHQALRSHIAPNLRRFILGDTDSETLFYLFLTCLMRLTDPHRRGTKADLIATALAEVVTLTRSLADTDDEPSKLTFIVTDGLTMVGLRSGGTPLLYSTHKRRCSDRDLCPFLSKECEAPTETGFVNHLVLSSEELQGENVWVALDDGEIIGVDWRMNLFQSTITAVGEH